MGFPNSDELGESIKEVTNKSHPGRVGCFLFGTRRRYLISFEGVLDADLPTQAPDSNGSNAPSHPEDNLTIDRSSISLGSTTTHKPVGSIYYRIEKGQTGQEHGFQEKRP